MSIDVAGDLMQALIYARVSSKEQEIEGFSIPAQLKLLRAYAQEKGLTVVEEYTDIETARKPGRARFDEMVSYLRRQASKGTANKCQLILVEKTDRLYRNLKDYVVLDELDLVIHFVKENFVLSEESRSTEKFIHGIKVLMAKNYVDNLSEETQKGMREKAAQGLWPTRAPFGYLNVERDDKRFIEQDAKTIHVVGYAFEWYATGRYSLEQLTKRMNTELLPTISRRSKFTRSSIHRMLTNPLYYGDFIWHGKLYHGTHKPIISKEQFYLAQEMLSAKGNHRARQRQHKWAFQGLVKCGHCGCALTAELKKGKYVYYHCTGHKGKCPEKYVREEELAQQFGEALKGIQMDDELLEWVKTTLLESHDDEKRFHEESIAKLQAERQRLKDRIETMYVDKLDGTVSMDFFERKSSEWREELELIRQQIDRHESASHSYIEEGVKILELCQRASQLYAEQEVHERRRLLDFVFSNCLWQDARLIPVFREPFNHLSSANTAYKEEQVASGRELAKRERWQAHHVSNLLCCGYCCNVTFSWSHACSC